MGEFGSIYSAYERYLGDAAALLMQANALMRYELESASNDAGYEGTFKLPESFFQFIPTRAKVLEIAMADGVNLTNIVERTDPSEVVGFDFSHRLVARARRNLREGLLLRADAQSLPFKDDYFDFVMAFNLLDRVPDTRRVLSEINRVTSDGGCVVLGNCNPLQNDKTIAGGTRMLYVPEGKRVRDMNEAIHHAGLQEVHYEKGIRWDIKTIADGAEILFVDVHAGRKIS